MDIPPLPRQLLAQLKPLLSAQNVDEALAPGKRLSATVEKVSEVTPELRARLLSLFVDSKNAEGKGAKPAPIPPTLSQALARQALSGQIPAGTAKASGNENTNQLLSTPSAQSADTKSTLNQLLASKLLQLVEVKVLNRNLLLLTQVALSPNTKLAFQVRPDGQLQLINTNLSGAQKTGAATTSPSSSTTQAPQNGSQTGSQLGAATTSSADKNNAQLISQHYKAQAGIKPSPENQAYAPPPLNTDASKSQALHQAIKTYLPLQQNLANSLNQIETLMNASNTTNLENQLPKLAPILNQVNKLVEQIPQFKQLTQSRQLQMVIEKSGFFLERNLRQLAQSPPNPTTIVNTTTSTSSTITTRTQISGQERPINQTPTEKQFEDFKASVLRLVNDLNQVLTSTNTNPVQNKSQSFDSLIRSIFSFAQESKSKTNQQSQQQMTATVARHLHTTLFSAIARITHLQVQQLLQQDGGPSANGFSIEIPVRFGEQLVPLSLSVHEKMYEDRKENSEDDKKKDKKRDVKKRWHVFMEFDLDEYGSFASEITVQQGSVATTLWVQQHDLWRTTHDHIGELKKELENNGVEVEAITLHQGKAPEKPLQLNQSLVDIRT